MRWLALVGLVAIGGLGATMAARRSSERSRYETARALQRKETTAARRAPPAPPASAPVKAPRCVRGVDTFASALARVEPMPDKANRQKRLAWLRDVSDEAVRDERLAERSRPAPTLPKRMGTDPAHEPITPAKPACDGSGFAELP